MAEFVLLYGGGGRPETEDEQAEVRKAWDGWLAQVGDDLKDAGNPFTPAAKAIGSDGSVADATPIHSGYSIVRAESLDAAVTIAKDSPVLQGGGTVTVYETFEAM